MHRGTVISLIMLTALDGSPVWVEATQIQIIRIGSTECGPNTGAVIRVGLTTLCVKETQDTVREKIKANGGGR